MKYVIASDLHGSAYYCKKIVDIFEKEGGERLILLGDIYNHGPRNPLPKDYAPIEVSGMLNKIVDKLMVIQGNCDSEVDAMISDFDFFPHLMLTEKNKTLLLTHGHKYNKDNLPKTKFDCIIYGHFHTGFIEKQNGVVVANTGSLSLPKNNTPNSYMVLEDGVLTLKALDGNIINQINI